MTYKKYCDQIGIKPKSGYSKLDEAKPALEGRALLFYKVPELTPDGTCSAGDGLALKPYDLRKILGIRTAAEERVLVSRLESLLGLLRTAQLQIKADWIGIYQKVKRPDGTLALVKLVYEGKPSRAEFPLTQEFLELSNNTKVGLSGKAVVINDVNKHPGPYYVCDALVQSEACLPIYDPTGENIVGIVDAESFKPKHFNDNRLAKVAQFSYTLADYLPLRIY